MNILIVPSWYPTQAKPVNGVFIREQATALSREHNIRVLYIDMLQRGEKRAPNHLVKNDNGYPEEIIEVRNLPLVWQFLYLLAMWKALSRLKHTFKPHIVHTHIAVPATWGAILLRRILKVPIVLTENSSEFDSWLKRPGLRWMAKIAFARTDMVIAVSEGQRQRIESTFHRKHRLVLVPNIVDTDRFVLTDLPEITEDAGYQLLFVGLMDTTQKGIHILLESIAAIQRSSRLPAPLHLILIGDGQLRPQYQEQARLLGIEDVVTFRGLVPHSDIAEAMHQCHALVLPSFHEALPLVIIEAMASGRPIIATRCGGPEYMVDEQTGVVVEPGQPQPLADAIVDVITHLDRYSPQHIAAVAKSRYSYQSVADALTGIYESISRKRK